MKIGIITFHASHNCGSLLQAYALQQTLFKEGYENEIINFANQGSKDMYSIMPPIIKEGRIRGYLVKYFLKSLPYISIIKRQSDFYNEFINKYLVLSKKEYSSNKDLCLEKFEYTHYITGSDQVWNICCSDADDAYFLNFVKQGKRIAYAVSLGATIIKEKATNYIKYIDLLKKFDAISVREKNAIKQINEMSDKDVELLIDPTLLYLQSDWEKSFDLTKRIIEEDYIFYYAFHYNDEVNKIVMEISKRYKLPVYIIDAKSWGPRGKRKSGLKLCKESGPIAFLNLIKNAKLVLTTSFHGTVFSVIFRKKFWFIDSSFHSHFDDRTNTLVSMLGLTDRMISGEKLLKINPIDEEIDYRDTSIRITELQQKAITFLKRNII